MHDQPGFMRILDQALVQVLCEDHVGTYLLPFLCLSTLEGLRNERTGELIEANVVGWRVKH